MKTKKIVPILLLSLVVVGCSENKTTDNTNIIEVVDPNADNESESSLDKEDAVEEGELEIPETKVLDPLDKDNN